MSVDLQLIYAVVALFLFSTISYFTEKFTYSRAMGKLVPLTKAKQSCTAIKPMAQLGVNTLLTALSETLHQEVCCFLLNPCVRFNQRGSQTIWREGQCTNGMKMDSEGEDRQWYLKNNSRAGRTEIVFNFTVVGWNCELWEEGAWQWNSLQGKNAAPCLWVR